MEESHHCRKMTTVTIYNENRSCCYCSSLNKASGYILQLYGKTSKEIRNSNTNTKVLKSSTLQQSGLSRANVGPVTVRQLFQAPPQSTLTSPSVTCPPPITDIEMLNYFQCKLYIVAHQESEVKEHVLSSIQSIGSISICNIKGFISHLKVVSLSME